MNATPTFTPRGSTSSFVAAVLATVIAVGMLSAVATMFQRNGKPLERLAAAERACMQHSYLSERHACMNEWLAAARPGTLARR